VAVPDESGFDRGDGEAPLPFVAALVGALRAPMFSGSAELIR
jgi:hypothetical protein